MVGVDENVSTMPVEWGSQQAGTYTLLAQIDQPDNEVPETDESNNLITRSFQVLPPAPDTVPPTINSLPLNNGEAVITDRTVTLLTTATDNSGGSGMKDVFYQEFHYNIGAQTWVPVQNSSKLAYGPRHTWNLHPAGGMRYIRASRT